MDFIETLNKLNEAWNLPKEEIEAAKPLMQEIIDAIPEVGGYKLKLDVDSMDMFEKNIDEDGNESWWVPAMIDDTLYDSATWEGDASGEVDPYNCGIEPYRNPETIIKDDFADPLTSQLPIDTAKFTITKVQVDDSDGYDCLPDESKDYTEKRGNAGIGHYEYWGTSGYDSKPYTEFEGTAEYVGGQVFVSVLAVIKR